MNPKDKRIALALVDDHHLVRSGLKLLIENIMGFDVQIEASNGREFLDKLDSSLSLPQIALIDVSMPIMDGYETTRKLNQLFPPVKVVALSVHDDINTISSMIDSGANAYLLKDSHPEIVKNVLLQVIENGFYYDRIVIESLLKNKEQNRNKSQFAIDLKSELTPREIESINHCCSELTYKEIADKMSITPRTVDGYRESVF